MKYVNETTLKELVWTNDLEVSKGFLFVFDKKVEGLIIDAMIKARNNRRKRLMKRDV